MKNMIKLLLLIILLPSLCFSQYFRDNFLGTYPCTVREAIPAGGFFYWSDVLYVIASSTDTNNIIISDSISWIGNYEFILHLDSTYEHIWSPNQRIWQFL